MSGIEAGQAAKQTVSRALLVLLRVYLGVVFLTAAWPKLSNWDVANTRNFFIQRSHEFYRPFLEGVVLANPGVFNVLVPYGELLVGLALVAGALTRLAGAAAMFMTLNYMLLKGAWFWHASSNDAAFFFIALVLVLGSAGRMWGVDEALAKQRPGGVLW